MSEKDGTTPNEIGQFAETLRAIIPATASAVKKYVSPNFSIFDLNKILNQNGEVLTNHLINIFEKMRINSISSNITKTSSWLDKILESEKKSHLAFFGKEFDLTQFAETLQKYGKKRIQDWKRLGLEVHFLPNLSFGIKDNYHGWKIKSNDWFYENVANGKIRHDVKGNLITLRRITTEGNTMLIDTRCKPQYTGGSQMYENDNFLGSIILKLRKEGKINGYTYGSLDSRFNISAYEFQTQLKPEIAKLLGLKIYQVRFEKTIEANLIPQIYLHMPRKDDGNTNTWCWYGEYFSNSINCLNGGNSDDGGLSYVGFRNSDGHWSGGSVRSVAVL